MRKTTKSLLFFYLPDSICITCVIDAPEEEEEEDLVDPQGVLRDECIEKNAKCQELKDILDKCNERVAVNPAIEEETCEEELIDFVHCVDHCVSKSLFSKLV